MQAPGSVPAPAGPAAPGVGVRPQLPAVSLENGWDEQSAFAAAPTPTSWGEQAPHHPGSQAHPALAQTQASSLLRSWGRERGEGRPHGGGKGQEPPPSTPILRVLCPSLLPPWRELPEPGVGLEKRTD